MQKWTSTAGPNQTKAVHKAISGFETKACQTEEIKDWGTVIVSKFQIAALQQVHAGFIQAMTAIGEMYDWTITRKNASEIRKTIDAEKEALQRPVVDCRTKKGVEPCNKSS